MHDARHTGTSSVVGPRSGATLWTRDLGADVTPGTVIGSDGSVIVATNAGVLYALEPATGRTRWTFEGGSGYGNDLSTSASILADGTIAWPGPGGRLYGLTPDGTLLWQVELGGFVLSPAVAESGRIYVVTMSGTMSAIDVGDGAAQVVWSVDTGSGSYASPSIAPDGTIVTTSAHAVVGVSDEGASGLIRWTHPIDTLIEVSPAIGPDGTVVVGTNDRQQYGLDGATGELRWTVKRGDETYSSPVVTPQGLAYYGDHTATLYVADVRTGTLVRSTTTRAERPGRSYGIWTAPAVDAEGAAFYGTRSGHIFGVGPDGTQLFDLDVGGTVDSYPALDAHGTLYIGSSNGTLYAVAAG